MHKYIEISIRKRDIHWSSLSYVVKVIHKGGRLTVMVGFVNILTSIYQKIYLTKMD
jgi:hypothetical protein